MSAGIYIFLFIITFIFSVNVHACNDYGIAVGDSSLYQPGKYYDGTEWHDCEEDRYCTGDGMERCCPENFPNSTPGNADIENCYAPCAIDSDNYDTHTKYCGFAYGNSVLSIFNVSCIQNGILEYGTTDQNYHIEVLDDNSYGCYLNTRDCSKFTTAENDGTSLDKEKNIGYASWNQSNGYDVTNCRHVTDDETYLTNCRRKTFYKPLNSTNLQNAQGVLRFLPNYTTDVGHLDKYFCIECLSASDYPLSTKPANIHKCQNPDAGESYKACQCQAIPQGYYSSTGQKWTIQDEVHTPPEPYHYKACPAGKTTGGGAVSAGECHYSRDTKFCDANGCFNITDADSGNWDWDY